MLKNHALKTDSLVVVALLAMLQSLPVSAVDVPAQLPAQGGKPSDTINTVRVIKAKPADATSLQRLGEAVLASKPLAYWRMHDKDGAVATDASTPG